MLKYVHYCEYHVDSRNILSHPKLVKIKDNITCFYEKEKQKDSSFDGASKILSLQNPVFSHSIKQIIDSSPEILIDKQLSTFHTFCIATCNNETVDKSLARHIRNSFSHWNFYLKKCSGSFHILFIDFTNKGVVSAVICCRMKSIEELSNIYSQ